MGADSFQVKSSGETAQLAFQYATSDARHEHGHGGYTGSIAEKRSFRMLSVPEGKTIQQFADEILWDDDHWITEKSGPAGCIALGGNEYLFLGIARC